jgi:antirestriction protein ArdC
VRRRGNDWPKTSLKTEGGLFYLLPHPARMPVFGEILRCLKLCAGQFINKHKPKGISMNNEVYASITRRIVTLLEQGTVPWHKPWNVKTGWPRNLVTKKPYRGINVFLLTAASYESPYWLTFRQALELGGCVRKAERSCRILFWDQKTIEDEESGEERKVPLFRLYSVFNVAQCDGLEEALAANEPEPVAITKPEEIVEKMPKRPKIKHGTTESFYSPREDCVSVPTQKQFDRKEEYYSTLFHELVHATGHESRLGRATLTEKAGFGSNPYCKEELIAEMGAAFLCGHAEIIERTIDNSAAYLLGWLAQLKNDKTLIVQAAAQAQRAADFILGTLPQEPQVNGVESTPQPAPLEAAA